MSHTFSIQRMLTPRRAVVLACVCAAAGLFTISSSVRFLYAIWSTDALKSIGLAVPFVCAALILREWRRIGWEMDGTWWGFALLAGAAALVFVRDQTLLMVMVNKSWLLQLPPLPLLAVLYALAIVLLFGGKRLARAAWFPILLMWSVIPVPNTFSSKIDLPLQHVSAEVARGFAHLLGQQLTEDKLRLIFTPKFGMFIAPGCDGIRGAVTLGLAAIVISYLYRFRWVVAVPVVAGAVLLGYVFNFLRLCLLVLYYKLALPSVWMQHHGKIADYIIGGCLFTCALLIFFAVTNKLRRDGADSLPLVREEAVRQPSRAVARSYALRAAAVLVLAGVFAVDTVHEVRAERSNDMAAAPAPLPAVVGGWTRVRTWNERLLNGWIVYTFAEYAAPGNAPAGIAGARVDLGVSPRLGVHDAEVCHLARGLNPQWHGQMVTPTAAGDVVLSAATYNDGTNFEFEAQTVCESGRCEQFDESDKHVTLVVSPPEGRLPMEHTLGPVPVLLRVEAPDTSFAPMPSREQMQAQIEAFLRGADLAAIAAPYGHRE